MPYQNRGAQRQPTGARKQRLVLWSRVRIGGEKKAGKADHRKPTPPHATPPGKFRDPLLHPALTFASSRPSQCLSRISVCGFLCSPLIVLSKRLNLTRNLFARHPLPHPDHVPFRSPLSFPPPL